MWVLLFKLLQSKVFLYETIHIFQVHPRDFKLQYDEVIAEEGKDVFDNNVFEGDDEDEEVEQAGDDDEEEMDQD